MINRINFSKNNYKIIKILNPYKEKVSTQFVGGYVRKLIEGISSNDVDLASNLKIDLLKKILIKNNDDDEFDMVNNNNSFYIEPKAVLRSGVVSGKTVLKITCGYQHTCAIYINSQVYCWGQNELKKNIKKIKNFNF